MATCPVPEHLAPFLFIDSDSLRASELVRSEAHETIINHGF